jgi:hypothetical protein
MPREPPTRAAASASRRTVLDLPSSINVASAFRSVAPLDFAGLIQGKPAEKRCPQMSK